MAVDQAADRAAKRTVEEMLVSIGIDPSNPLEAQRNAAFLAELRKTAMDTEFQNDMKYLRAWRTQMEGIKRHGTFVLIGIIIAGLCAAFWLGMKQYLRGDF